MRVGGFNPISRTNPLSQAAKGKCNSVDNHRIDQKQDRWDVKDRCSGRETRGMLKFRDLELERERDTRPFASSR